MFDENDELDMLEHRIGCYRLAFTKMVLCLQKFMTKDIDSKGLWEIYMASIALITKADPEVTKLHDMAVKSGDKGAILLQKAMEEIENLKDEGEST